MEESYKGTGKTVAYVFSLSVNGTQNANIAEQLEALKKSGFVKVIFILTDMLNIHNADSNLSDPEKMIYAFNLGVEFLKKNAAIILKSKIDFEILSGFQMKYSDERLQKTPIRHLFFVEGNPDKPYVLPVVLNKIEGWAEEISVILEENNLEIRSSYADDLERVEEDIYNNREKFGVYSQAVDDMAVAKAKAHVNQSKQQTNLETPSIVSNEEALIEAKIEASKKYQWEEGALNRALLRKNEAAVENKLPKVVDCLLYSGGPISVPLKVLFKIYGEGRGDNLELIVWDEIEKVITVDCGSSVKKATSKSISPKSTQPAAVSIDSANSQRKKEGESSPADVLIQEVKKHYLETHGCIPRRFHKKPIPIEEGYVRLAVVKEEHRKKVGSLDGSSSETEQNNHKRFVGKRSMSVQKTYETDKLVEITDMFKPEKDKDKDKTTIPKRLLILGGAGSGKSTSCQYMAYQWANSNAEVKLWEEAGQEKFKLVIWVPLRNLLEYQAGATICDVILKECISKDHTGKPVFLKGTIRQVRGAIREGLEKLNPEEILYICDGYDEVAGRTTPLIDKILSHQNIILTSRPHGVNEYLFSDAARMDTKFENIGFLDKDIRQYIQAFFGEGEDSQYIEPLIFFLETHPNIWGIAHIPINLMLICVAWKSNDLKKTKDITITDLYFSLVVNLGRRYLDKNKVEELDDFLSEDILGHEKCEPVLAVLSELAFKQMESESLLIPGEVFSRTKFRKQYPGLPSLRRDVIHFGVLAPTSSETTPDETDYYFIHLTFQEFLAAFYIAEKLRMKDKSIKQYILDYKYSLRHEMVWWFVAGLLKKEMNVLERFFCILEEAPRDLGVLYHRMLMMRCMDECQLIKVTRSRRKKFLDDLFKLIDIFVEKGFLGSTFLSYIHLSPTVFAQSEILDRFEILLSGEDDFQKEVALIILANRPNLPKKIIDRIAQLLKNPNSSVRQEAVKFFSEQKDILPELIDNIVPLLKDLDKEVREAAIKFFSQQKTIPRDVINSIVQLFNDPEWKVRVLARKCVGWQDDISQKLIDSIQEWSEDSKVGRAFVEIFIEGKDIINNVAQLLKDPKPSIKVGAVKFFSRQKAISPDVVNRIKQLFNDSERSVREAVVKFFSQQKDIQPEIIKSIAQLSNDPEWLVRYAVAEFFSQQKAIPPDVINSVIQLFNNPEWSVRDAAVRFLSQQKVVQSNVIKRITQLLNNPKWFVRKTAVKFFSQQKIIPPDVIKRITQLLKDRDKNVRCEVVCFFIEQKDIPKDTIDSIAQLLRDPDTHIKMAALRFFSKQKDIPKDAIDSIAQFLNEPEEDYSTVQFIHEPEKDLRKAAVEFFSQQKITPPEIIERIKLLLKDPERSVRLAVAKFFSQQKDILPDVTICVAQWIKDSDRNLRIFAVEFFSQQKGLAQNIINNLAQLLKDRDKYVREEVVDFFLEQEDVPQYIIDSIALLLKDPKYSVREAALGFFSIRKDIHPPQEFINNIPQLFKECESHSGDRADIFYFFEIREGKDIPTELINSIARLLTDPDSDIKSTAVHVFRKLKDIPPISPALINSIVPLLNDSDEKIREFAVGFFSLQQNLSTEILEKLGDLLQEQQDEFGYTDMGIVNDKSISFIVALMSQIDKRKMSSGFLRIFIAKLFLENIPVYQRDKHCIQIGFNATDNIEFGNEEERSEFIRNFRRVYFEFTGLNFEEVPKEFSQAENMAKFGIYPVSPESARKKSPADQLHLVVQLGK